MQLLSLCLYHCVLCVQYPHGWVLAPFFSLPSHDRDSRPSPYSCAHRDKHWFPFQLAFCLEARWKCIGRDLWSKQTKQPKSCRSLQARKERNKCEEPGLELRRVWRWRETEAWWAVGCPTVGRSPTLTQTLWPESLGGECQGRTSHPYPFQSSLSQTGHTQILIALVNSTCEIPCVLKEPERALSALSSSANMTMWVPCLLCT